MHNKDEESLSRTYPYQWYIFMWALGGAITSSTLWLLSYFVLPFISTFIDLLFDTGSSINEPIKEIVDFTGKMVLVHLFVLGITSLLLPMCYHFNK